MLIPIKELYYTSSEFGIESGRDGFGIRTYTEGFPLAVIRKLENDGLFQYQSGKKRVPASFELEENPNLPSSYPVTLTFQHMEVDGRILYFLVSTRLIGLDYGWYLDDQDKGARSGNLFSHVLLFENPVPQDLVLLFNEDLFLPGNSSNIPTNPELRSLLTGKLERLEPRDLELTSKLPSTFHPATAMVLKTIFQGVAEEKQVVVYLRENLSLQILTEVLWLLPERLFQTFRFQKNYQQYGINTDFDLILVNEYFPRQLGISEDYLFCDPIKNQISDLRKSEWTIYWANCFQEESWEELLQLRDFLDDTGIELRKKNWDQLLPLYQFIRKNKASQWPTAVVKSLQDIGLKEFSKDFLNEVLEKGYGTTSWGIGSENWPLGIKALATIGGAIGDYQYPESIKQVFSRALLTGQVKLDVSLEEHQNLARELLLEDYVRRDWKSFFDQPFIDILPRQYFLLEWWNVIDPADYVQLVRMSTEKGWAPYNLLSELKPQLPTEDWDSFLKAFDYGLFLPPELYQEYFENETNHLLKEREIHSLPWQSVGPIVQKYTIHQGTISDLFFAKATTLFSKGSILEWWGAFAQFSRFGILPQPSHLPELRQLIIRILNFKDDGVIGDWGASLKELVQSGIPNEGTTRDFYQTLEWLANESTLSISDTPTFERKVNQWRGLRKFPWIEVEVQWVLRATSNTWLSEKDNSRLLCSFFLNRIASGGSKTECIQFVLRQFWRKLPDSREGLIAVFELVGSKLKKEEVLDLWKEWQTQDSGIRKWVREVDFDPELKGLLLQPKRKGLLGGLFSRSKRN